MSALPGGLTLAVPSKGRLEELTRKVFSSARLAIARPGGARSYIGAIKSQPQVTVRFYPAAEIARELILGGVNIGVTGTDLIYEASENGEENVLFVPGKAFHVATGQPSPALRLSFATPSVAEIEEGVRRLARALARV